MSFIDEGVYAKLKDQLYNKDKLNESVNSSVVLS